MLGLAIMGFGGLLLLGGIWGGLDTYRLLRQGIRVEGTVVRVTANQQRRSSGGTITVYSPVYEYVDAKGNTQQVEIGESSHKPALGVRANLIYDPEHPNVAIHAGTKQLLGPVGLLVGAVFAIYLGWILRSQG